MKIDYFKLIISIGISFAAGGVGSVFTMSEIPTWYAGLEKPEFNPPNWIFGPVWTTLYILMGIALYIVWKAKTQASLKQRAFLFFFIQLILNSLWSIIFFGSKNIGVALFEIVILWGMIVVTIVYFRKISKVAAYLLYPYIAWVSFATILNLSIYLLN